ncbi:phage tail protein [Pseudooceanicola sp. CBS1P-1]|uniref:Uncharacterized protein n=1 Tax=Pseudooceanicola albus TaxID=2692189 RepID=A0A6L7FYF3_9RHOB|nr:MULTISPECIES: phage tail protein [Pseudooceanicola]MBT9383331.1 phage tail protein [Pseudooceanicola endophyticus]MXN16346.1 hypothetical protein [Pseudooceanicola albus]
MPTTLLTDVAEQKINLAAGSGSAVVITHIAVGDGGGATYDPSNDQSALQNEVARVAVYQSELLAPNSWRVRAEFGVDTAAAYVREIGFFDQDGDLISVWAGADVVPRQTGAIAYLIDHVLNFSRVAEGLVIVKPDAEGTEYLSPDSLLKSQEARRGEGATWAAKGGFLYREAAEGAEDAHVTTAGGVGLYVVPINGVINAAACGALGDGETDDAGALQAAIAATEAQRAILQVTAGAGAYRYGAELKVTKPISFLGSGRRNTIFEPMDGYSGWFMSITETSFVGSGNQSDELNIGNDNAGVTLADFSVRSSRTGVVQHGFRCVGRNDRMQWRSVYVEQLQGTHFHFGYNNGVDSDGDDNPSFIRECDFYNVESRGGGDADSKAPAVVIDSWGIGDATNLCNFYSMRVVYARHVGMDIRHNGSRVRDGGTPIAMNAIRRLHFYSLLLHATTDAAYATSEPTVRITGWVNLLTFSGLMMNSFAADQTAVEVNARTMSIYDGTTYTDRLIAPDGLSFDCDVSAGDGKTFVFNGVGAVDLKMREVAAIGTDLTVGAAVTGPIVVAAPQDTTMDIATEAANKVFCYNNKLAGLNMVTTGLTVGVYEDSPRILSGSGSPVGAVSAPAGSLYMRKDQAPGEKDSDQLWAKYAGSESNGWFPLQLAAYFNDASYPSALTPGASYVVDDLRRIGAATSDGEAIQAAMWRDTPPTSATDDGQPSEMASDGAYLYLCVAANTWVRAGLSTWT